jgi:predicted Zn-dependent protease
MRYSYSIFVIIFIFTACATTNLKPVTDKNFVYKDDEKRLWIRSQEEQDVLNNSGLLYEDPKVEEYLNAIASKLYSQEVYEHIPFKILVLKDPHFNAFAFPNGVIYVHTGILARAENEAQIATLLAHEMTHCTHRHAVKNFRSTKNKTAVFATIQVTTGGLGGGVGDISRALGALGTLAAVTGYSRELESEADTVGFRLIVNAGYDPKEAPKLFMHLKEELKEEKISESFFFGSHPRLQERIQNYEHLIDNEYSSNKSGIKNSEIFLENIQDMILENAVLDLKLGRFTFSQKGVEKYLRLNPNHPKAYFVLGEIFNQKGEKGDIEKSIDYYKKSIDVDSSYQEPYRELGLIYYKQGKKILAKEFFQQYLSLSMDAPDRQYIEYYMKQID